MGKRTPKTLACSLIVSNVALILSSTVARAQDPAAEPAPAPEPAPTVSATATVEGTAGADGVVEVAPPPQAEEAAPPPLGLNVQVAFGLGLRSEFSIDPDAPEPADAPIYAVNNNLRPYINGQVHDNIKFEGNLDSTGSDIFLLDAVLKFEFSDYANIWMGRFLPPSDRANLSGPYFQNAWTYPVGVHLYPAVYAGRDDGIAYWGQYNGGQFKWQLGLFDMGGGTPDPRLAARLVYNVLDPEPGYYNSSTYYGTKDVLAIGAVLQHQPAPDGAPDEAANTLWNLDVLYENTFAGSGTLNVEGAFYGFGGADQGTSFFVLGSYLLANRVGIGQFQPVVRLQRAAWSDGDTFNVATIPGFNGAVMAPPGEDASLLTVDAGIAYVINAHNARLAATIQHSSLSVADADSETNTVLILGAQIQAF